MCRSEKPINYLFGLSTFPLPLCVANALKTAINEHNKKKHFIHIYAFATPACLITSITRLLYNYKYTHGWYVSHK